MPNIYALLVGINAYPIKPLQGCINDVKAMQDCLRTLYGSNSNLQIKLLTDDTDNKPTRANLIAAFDHFSQAAKGDTCLFYYSGHGSYSPAPAEFWTDTNGFVQSFVCQDSRLPGGTDLMDKEMGYLIWKMMNDKPGTTFVAITDCCHSGTLTKAIDNSGITDRMMQASNVPMAVKDYLGYDATANGQHAYEVSADGKKVTVRQADHIHIAASRDNQTSKELTIDGQKRGAFTHSLIKTLFSCGGQLSYQELVSKAAILVKNLVPDQSPDLNINGNNSDEERKKLFLSKDSAAANPKYLVYYDNNYGWCIKAGLAHAVSDGDIIDIEGVCTTVVTGSPSPEISTIKKQDSLGGIEKTYFASVDRQPNQLLKISFAPVISSDVKAFITARQKAFPSDFLDLLTESSGQYIIRTNENNEAYITLPGDEQAVFKPAAITDADTAADFLDNVETVSKWLHLQEINNEGSLLTSQHYTIKLYRSVEAGNFDINTFEQVKEIKLINELYYKQKDGTWKQPAFRLSITNSTVVPLWVTAAYLGFDYSIGANYFSPMEVAPGKEAWLQFINGGLTTEVIKTRVDAKYQLLGYNEITEYLKLFIATDKVPTDSFEQEGVELAKVQAKGLKKSFSLRTLGDDDGAGTTSKIAWQAETIGIKTIRPQNEIAIEPNQPTSLKGFTIASHKLLQSKVIITSSIVSSGVSDYVSNTLSSKAMPQPSDTILPPHLANQNSYLEPFDLVADGTRTGKIMDVLELFDANKQVVTKDDPLVIQRDATRSTDDSSVIPIGYDASTKLYYPLGYMDKKGNIIIDTLPDETPSDSVITQRSFFGSIKIYFQKVIGQKLGFGYTYPRLAKPEVDETLSVKYDITDAKIIKEAVTAADIVLLFIHGIIGDTEGMVKCIKTPLDNIGNTLQKDDKTVVLSFDYENLNTPIEETAADLKKKLEAVGLKDGEPKKLIIIAHSMGGLVSRWFIEKAGGDKVVKQLIMLGTPNNGTPWTNVGDLAETLLTYAINGSAFLKPWMLVLNGLGKLVDTVQYTFKQMDSEKGIYKVLNAGGPAEVSYTIIMGNTQKIIVNYDDTATLISRLFKRLKRHGAYDALDLVLFRKPNDIAVADESISNLSVTTSAWTNKPVVFEVACDHLNYFTNTDALQKIYSRL